jgi:ArsR family transcriptional regulator
MDSRTRARFAGRAKIVKALAHPTRLFIVDELSRRERRLGELADMVGADASTVSKHMTILRDAGIVHADKRGREVYFALRVPCVRRFFECVESVLQANVKGQLAMVE